MSCLHVCLYTVHIPGAQRPEEAIRFPEPGIRNGCELPCGSFGVAPGALNDWGTSPFPLPIFTENISDQQNRAIIAQVLHHGTVYISNFIVEPHSTVQLYHGLFVYLSTAWHLVVSTCWLKLWIMLYKYSWTTFGLKKLFSTLCIYPEVKL